MTRCFSKSYPEIHNLDLHIYLDDASSTDSSNHSVWSRWMIRETARRTIFLANIVNFFSNRNPISGRQSPYYEPIDDEVVLNMPLPCSDALWSARTEDEWTGLVMQLHEPGPSAGHSLSEFNTPLPESLSLNSSQDSIKSLLSKLTREYLQMNLCKSVGFSNSDELRSFIILCALEQFG